MDRRRLIAGNWKMNGSRPMLVELDRIAEVARAAPSVDVAIAPPFTLLADAAPRAGAVMLGGQDCHQAAQGAPHRGEVPRPDVDPRIARASRCSLKPL